jgi:hypothetical protein
MLAQALGDVGALTVRPTTCFTKSWWRAIAAFAGSYPQCSNTSDSVQTRAGGPSSKRLIMGTAASRLLRAAEPRPPSLGRDRPHPQNPSHAAHPGRRGAPATHGPGASSSDFPEARTTNRPSPITSHPTLPNYVVRALRSAAAPGRDCPPNVSKRCAVVEPDAFSS